MPDGVLPHALRVPHSRWRSAAKAYRRAWRRLTRLTLDARLRFLIVGFLLSFCLKTLYFSLRHCPPSSSIFHRSGTAHFTSQSQSTSPAKLFIAIGSAPGNFALRDAARSGWLRWLPADGSVTYRFFTDAPPSLRLSSPPAVDWARLRREAATHHDLVLQPLPTGYGSNKHNAYAQRGRYQAAWAVRNVEQLGFFLRVDDDSFLCLHRLMYELKSLQSRQFFWGRFWCREGRNRADENFMLFSSDIVELLADDALVGRLLPYDDQVTLGWNFGYWSWMLNLTVFDDQKRLDAQQGYLTQYMHRETPAHDNELAQFCDSFIYAHHVKPSTMLAAYKATKTHLMYQLPVRTGPMHTCGRKAQTFVPARHSKKLPDLRIGRSANGP